MSIDLTRRRLLAAGAAALAVPPQEPSRAVDPLAPRAPMFAARAESVIFIFIQGGLSQVDSFDYKPALVKYDGKKLTEEVLEGVGKIRTYNGENDKPLMRSPFAFRRFGQSGRWVSELFPYVGQCVDDLAFIHSLYNEFNNHAPAMFQLNTGSGRQGYPSVGAWVTYALGTRNRDLPGYLVMTQGNTLPIGGPANWGAGFLPAAYQGTMVRNGMTPILELHPPPDLSGPTQRGALDLLDRLNRRHLEARPEDTDLAARMAAYELAYRMQARTPEVMDLSGEPEETLRLYGIGDPKTDEMGRMCLRARRFVQRGVRFVQIYSGHYKCGLGWDSHSGLAAGHRRFAGECDRPIAGLLKDLKRTGLLSRTLVVFASEFGRMPITQGSDGRDHNPGVQTAWLAGGGVRGGVAVGSSDEIGYRAAEEPFHFRDLHATILYLLGLDDMKLTFYFNGRDQRLTDNGGRVVRQVLA
jgi:hypothetical protein